MDGLARAQGARALARSQGHGGLHRQGLRRRRLEAAPRTRLDVLRQGGAQGAGAAQRRGVAARPEGSEGGVRHPLGALRPPRAEGDRDQGWRDGHPHDHDVRGRRRQRLRRCSPARDRARARHAPQGGPRVVPSRPRVRRVRSRGAQPGREPPLREGASAASRALRRLHDDGHARSLRGRPRTRAPVRHGQRELGGGRAGGACRRPAQGRQDRARGHRLPARLLRLRAVQGRADPVPLRHERCVRALPPDRRHREPHRDRPAACACRVVPRCRHAARQREGAPHVARRHPADRGRAEGRPRAHHDHRERG